MRPRLLQRAAAFLLAVLAALVLSPAAHATTTGIPYIDVSCRTAYTDARGVTLVPCLGYNTSYNLQGEADIYTNGRAVQGCRADLIHVRYGNGTYDGRVFGQVFSFYVAGGNCTAQGQWPGMPAGNDEYVIAAYYELGGTWYGAPESPPLWWAS